MIALKQKLVHFEDRMDTGLEHFVNRHHILGYLIIFGGMPLFTLAMVGFCTIVLALPLGWLLGCI
jgi:hypothetical protein